MITTVRLIAFLLLAFAFTGSVARAQEARLLAVGTLRIGTYFVNPPFEFIDKTERVGFEVDLMNEVASRLSLKPVFVNTTWEKILQQMQDGLYDCIVGGITITPERKRTLAWSTPYMTTTLSLVIDSAKSPDIRGMAELRKATLGVQAAPTDYDVANVTLKRGEIGSLRVYAFDHIDRPLDDLAPRRVPAGK